VASNRVGTETFKSSSITFYGGSFVCGPDGGIASQVHRVGQMEDSRYIGQDSRYIGMARWRNRFTGT